MYRSVILTIISGLLFALSWPTKGFAGFLFVAFVPLLLIEHQFSQASFKRKGLRIFLLSWLAFLIWNAYSYAWLSQARPRIGATSQEIGQAWFAYLFPVFANSLFMATVFLCYHWVKKRNGNVIGLIFLPAFWMSFEKLHLNWEFAWPWLNLGNGFASYYKWIQWYDTTGTFGGTLWVFLANFSIFYLTLSFLSKAKAKSKKIRFGILSFVIIILPIAISYYKYNHYTEKGDPLKAMVLQPNLDPYREKYTKTGVEIVDELLDLADEKVNDDSQLIITPETSFPGSGKVSLNTITEDPLIKKFKDWLSIHRQIVFLTGVELNYITQATKPPNKASIEYGKDLWYNGYNSVIQMEYDQDTIPAYHKSKLVVGVELFPYRDVFEPLLGKAMLNFGGSTYSLTTQRERTVFRNSKNTAAVAPLVCYESIFGEFTSQFVKNGANLISVSTNDSWWGDNDGHRQFLDYARLRAIENRRDVVRAANTGISAHINQKGDLVNSLPYDSKGVKEFSVYLNRDLTNYTQVGDVIARLGLFISGIFLAFQLAGIILSKQNKNRSKP